MRKKAEILKAYIDKGADAKSDAHLSMLTVVNLLEVQIDIRDILQKALRLVEILALAKAKTPH